MTQVIAIVGPTAVGKSALADRLAATLGTSVVSADAMQVYRGMDIGTAKMTSGECAAPLLLVDIVDPDQSYSAALYQADARREIDSLLGGGKIAVMCGGTGLYVRAALDEMDFPTGEVDGSRRSRYDALARELGPEGIHALLMRRDPESAAVIHPHNVRRVVRALEMLDEGVSYAKQKAGFSQPKARYDTSFYALTMDRARLYERIDRRVDTMFEKGLVNEVKKLKDAGFSTAITSRQAIGYKEVLDALDGCLTMDEARALIKQRSRRYAKRQLSWFRRDARMVWIDMDEQGLDGALDFIRSREGM